MESGANVTFQKVSEGVQDLAFRLLAGQTGIKYQWLETAEHIDSSTVFYNSCCIFTT